jgi:signal peptidase I
MNKGRIIKLIKNIVYYATTLGLLLVIGISLFVPNGLVKTFGVGWYRVVSESMEPLIMTGDYIIVVNDTNIETLSDGDIIIFETHFYNRQVRAYVRDVVTHHYYGLDDEGYVLTYPHSQYDLEPEARRLDEWRTSSTEIYRLKQSDIIGRHTTTIRASLITAFLVSPYGIGVVVINVILITLFVVLYKNDKKQRLTQAIENDKDTDLEETFNENEESGSDDVANMDK